MKIEMQRSFHLLDFAIFNASYCKNKSKLKMLWLAAEVLLMRNEETNKSIILTIRARYHHIQSFIKW